MCNSQESINSITNNQKEGNMPIPQNPIHQLIPVQEDKDFKEETMSIPEISDMEVNPFPITKEELMKLTIKHEDGTITEKNLWYVNTPIAEMNSMTLVKAFFDSLSNHFVLEQLMDQQRFLQQKGVFGGSAEEDGYKDNQDFFSHNPIELLSDNLEELYESNKNFSHAVQSMNFSRSQRENFAPGYAYSVRLVKSKVEKIETGSPFKHDEYDTFVDYVRVDEMLVSEMTNGDKFGWIVEFVTATINRKGQHYKKKWPAVCLINKTPSGYRMMWKIKPSKKNPKGSIKFGSSYSSMAGKKLVPTGIESMFTEFRLRVMNPGEILPILKYMPLTSNPQLKEDLDDLNLGVYGFHLHPYGITMRDIYWIGGETSVKKILNRAFKHPHGITKNIFGGISKIDSFERLRAAIFVLRAARGFNPHMLEKLDIDLIANTIHLGFHLSFGTTESAEAAQSFFHHFGFKDRYFNEIFVSYDFRMNLSTVEDIMMTFKQIKGRKHRTAIKQHIARAQMSIDEIDEFVSSEYNKIRHENKSFAKSKVTQVFGEFDGQWIDENIQLVVPKGSHELIEWGSTQNNCIGSYGDRLYSNQTMIIGFKDVAGNWIAHAEIEDNHMFGLKLKQLLGKHNQPVDKVNNRAIVKFLAKSCSVHIPTDYWGAIEEDRLRGEAAVQRFRDQIFGVQNQAVQDEPDFW